MSKKTHLTNQQSTAVQKDKSSDLSSQPEQMQKADELTKRDALIADLERTVLRLRFENINLRKENLRLQEQMLVEITEKDHPELLRQSSPKEK